MIKTFRGRLAKGAQDRIRLTTMKGKVGYRIVKFQVMGTSEDENYESTVQIWSGSNTGAYQVDFTNQELLAAILYGDSNAAGTISGQTVIFDNKIFNQDIYVTFESASTSADINYYIELEVIELSELGAEYTTLQDIRTQTQ